MPAVLCPDLDSPVFCQPSLAAVGFGREVAQKNISLLGALLKGNEGCFMKVLLPNGQGGREVAISQQIQSLCCRPDMARETSFGWALVRSAWETCADNVYFIIIIFLFPQGVRQIA